MKKKISKIMGVGLAFVLLVGMIVFAIPASAAPGQPYSPLAPPLPNMWTGFFPTPAGPPGFGTDTFFFDPVVDQVGPMAEAINGDVYAHSGVYSLGTDYWTITPGSAAWATTPFWVTGNYSAALTHTVASQGSAYVEFEPAPGMTLADLGTTGLELSFWENTAGGAAAAQMELRFTAPSCIDPNGVGHVDVTIYGFTGTGVWAKHTIAPAYTTVGYYGNDPTDGTAFNNWAAMAVNAVLTNINAEAAMLAGADTANLWELTRVRMEVWANGTARTSYVDDVTVNGYLYHVEAPKLYKSSPTSDVARGWAESTSPNRYGFGLTAGAGPIIDMVCSSVFEDVLYVTDGNYVYKSIDGGLNFNYVAKSDLEAQLMGDCNIPITGWPITSIDVGYDGSDKPIVFIGTKHVLGRIYAAPHTADFVVGSVYWIADETFSATWTDLELKCYGACCDPELPAPDMAQAGCFDVFSVATAPGFSTNSKTYLTISKPTTLNFKNNTAATITLTADAVTGATIAWTTTPVGITDPNLNVNSAGAIVIAPGAAVTFTSAGINNAGRCDVIVTAGGLSTTVAPIVLTAGDATWCDESTQVLYTTGGKCAWNFVAELCWNCVVGNVFDIIHASRMVFPSYYGTNPTVFVGVVGRTYGGDVYMVADTAPPTTPAIDVNVQGFVSGCIGVYHANIFSLDINANDGMLAGAYDSYQLQSPVRVYYSADGGWTWSPSFKDPTGLDRAYVLWAGDMALAGTRYCECAVSMSCGASIGMFWNQISLISMEIDQVLDLTHAPGYVLDNSTMYVLTYMEDSCPVYDVDAAAWTEDSVSLLRWDGTYWERVHSSRYYLVIPATAVLRMNAPQYEWVETSPDFNDTLCLYLANTGFDLARSLDAGCSWAPLTFPCEPKPEISAWIVVDLETVLASGPHPVIGEVVWKTTSHGTQPWIPFPVPTFPAGTAADGVDFDLSPTITADNTVIFGDQDGNVFISKDVGETWEEIMDFLTFSFNSGFFFDTYVVFDPGYGTADDPGENTVYAAAGRAIGRCTINHDASMLMQDWLYLSNAPQTDCDPFSLCLAAGIDAAGDTALYVADAGVGGVPAGVTVCGTIEMECCVLPDKPECSSEDIDISCVTPEAVTTISGPGWIDGELVEIIEYNVECSRTWMTHDTVLGCWLHIFQGDIGIRGYDSGTIGSIDISDTWDLLSTCAQVDCTTCGGGTIGIINSSYLVISAPAGGLTMCHTGVWRTLNPLDLIDELSGLNFVEFEFLDLTATSPTSVISHPAAVGTTFTVWPDGLWLTKASNMLWALDLSQSTIPISAFGYTYRAMIWMWDDVLAAPVIQISPANGSTLATSTTAFLEWEALDAATVYEVKVYEECPECLSPFKYKELTDSPYLVTMETCLTLTGLNPGKTHFWKVRVACDSPQVSKWSDLWSFDTLLSSTAFCSPWCGEEDISLTPNFSWSEVPYATSYEIEVSLTEDFATLVVSGTPTINAWDGVPEGAFEYGTTYYWRVRAINADGTPSDWTNCLFSTMEEPTTPAPPITPVTIVTEEITPVWIWVIIGIGAALVIAVIVLIVTTRRVS